MSLPWRSSTRLVLKQDGYLPSGCRSLEEAERRMSLLAPGEGQWAHLWADGRYLGRWVNRAGALSLEHPATALPCPLPFY